MTTIPILRRLKAQKGKLIPDFDSDLPKVILLKIRFGQIR